jgi:predicted nucleic acid-binding protein
MIIVDTNVISELMRPDPSPHVTHWVRAHSAELRLTSISLAEIRYGVRRLPPGRRRDQLATAADEIFAAFTAEILAFDAQAASVYPRIVCGREQAGVPIDGFDAQIAAICRSRAATLATRNVKDFKDTGVGVIDPWRESGASARP